MNTLHIRCCVGRRRRRQTNQIATMIRPHIPFKTQIDDKHVPIKVGREHFRRKRATTNALNYGNSLWFLIAKRWATNFSTEKPVNSFDSNEFICSETSTNIVRSVSCRFSIEQVRNCQRHTHTHRLRFRGQDVDNFTHIFHSLTPDTCVVHVSPLPSNAHTSQTAIFPVFSLYSLQFRKIPGFYKILSSFARVCVHCISIVRFGMERNENL